MAGLDGSEQVAHLIFLFRNADPGTVGAAMRIAKASMEGENSPWGAEDSIKFLYALFDWQIAVLEGLGVQERLLGPLRTFRSAVVTTTCHMKFVGEGKVPFLPVIPHFERSYPDCAVWVNHRGNRGVMDVHPALISNAVIIPPRFYYVLDVENGSYTRGKSAGTAGAEMQHSGRSLLTLSEAISLCVFTDVLHNHNLWVGNSFYNGDPNRIMEIALRGVSDIPYISCDWVSRPDTQYGSPSCAVRLPF